MTTRRLLSCLCGGLLLTAGACRNPIARGPSHETVVALLQQEADYLKKGGEDLPPSIGVKVTWTLEGLDVAERPGDKAFPWAGSIRFKIDSRSRDGDGNVTSDTFQKRFDYRFSSAIGKWIIDVPPAKTP